MPSSIASAYRSPVDLRRVFGSIYVGLHDDIVEAFIVELKRTFGESDVETKTGKYQKLSHRARMKKYPVRAIELLVNAPDYGGPSYTLPILARVMEPIWQDQWRDVMEAGTMSVMPNFISLSTPVLGEFQFYWIRAEVVRMTLSLDAVKKSADDRLVSLCLDAIDASERYWEFRGESLLFEKMLSIRAVNDYYRMMPSETDINAAIRYSTSAALGWRFDDTVDNLATTKCFDGASSAMALGGLSSEYWIKKSDSYKSIFAVVDKLINPSLLDIREYR
jgi:hypothetical protein